MRQRPVLWRPVPPLGTENGLAPWMTKRAIDTEQWQSRYYGASPGQTTSEILKTYGSCALTLTLARFGHDSTFRVCWASWKERGPEIRLVGVVTRGGVCDRLSEMERWQLIPFLNTPSANAGYILPRRNLGDDPRLQAAKPPTSTLWRHDRVR
jgi:hypothetical protein